MAQRSALCRSRRELSNEYLLAKIGVDTAENEPLEVWGKIRFIIHLPPYLRGCRCRREAPGAHAPRLAAKRGADFSICQLNFHSCRIRCVSVADESEICAIG